MRRVLIFSVLSLHFGHHMSANRMIHWLASRKLQTRLTVAVLLVVSPVVVIMLLTLGSLSASLLRTTAEQGLNQSAQYVADLINQWDHSFVTALQNLQGQPDIIGMNPDEQRPVIDQLKKVYDRLEIVRVTRP